LRLVRNAYGQRCGENFAIKARWSFLPLSDKIKQGAHRYPGRPFGDIGLFGEIPGRAGNIQVSPRSLPDELLEKGGGGNGAAVFFSDIFDIR